MFDNNEIKVEINNKKIMGKNPNIWRLNNIFQSDTWSNKSQGKF